MKRPHYWQRKQQLDGIIKKVEDVELDNEILSYLAKYICVLVCGWLETSVYEIIHDYVEKRSAPQIAKFVLSKLKRGRSLKKENLIELIEQFNEQWAVFLKEDPNSELVMAVSGIVGNRNLIAHGQTCNITFRSVKKYFEGIVEIVKIIEKNFA